MDFIKRQAPIPSIFDLSLKLSVPLEELHAEMKRKELQQQSKNILHQGCNDEVILQCREILVDWMAQVGDFFELSNLTIHLAVGLLDRLLNEYQIPKSRLQLVGACCILIAAKIEEQEEKIPPVADLNTCTDNAFTPELIVKMETLILNQLRWELTTITSWHFLGIYFNAAIQREEFENTSSEMSFDQARQFIFNYSEFFVDICRQGHNFLRFSPSIIASASLSAARKLLHMRNVWPEEMQRSTGYESEEILPITDLIWRTYEQNYQKLSPGS